MGNFLNLYLTIRRPRNFLILLCIFIGTSLVLHFTGGFDSDFGATNLILSIEASTAGAVLMMVAEGSAETQARMLGALLEMAQAQRDMLADHVKLLRALSEGDARILQALTEGEQDASSHI